MKQLITAIIAVTFGATTFGQNTQFTTKPKIDTSKESVAYWTKWNNDLYELGVNKNKDSFFVKPEVIRLMKDSAVRSLMYPKKYEWPVAVSLLKKMELKAGFWYLINLYQSDKEHRDIVIRTLCAYDSLIDMDKALISAFYTFAFPDPRVCKIENGRPNITRPDLLEQGLNATKEITAYIYLYREQRTAASALKPKSK